MLTLAIHSALLASLRSVDDFMAKRTIAQLAQQGPTGPTGLTRLADFDQALLLEMLPLSKAVTSDSLFGRLTCEHTTGGGSCDL